MNLVKRRLKNLELRDNVKVGNKLRRLNYKGRLKQNFVGEILIIERIRPCQTIRPKDQCKYCTHLVFKNRFVYYY